MSFRLRFTLHQCAVSESLLSCLLDLCIHHFSLLKQPCYSLDSRLFERLKKCRFVV